jgi:hypothetical protein
MKIFYISVIEKNAGWGMEYFTNKGFIKNNHTTINLDFRKNMFHLAEKFLDIKDEFDVLFLQRGDYFPIKLLKAVDCPRFFWASELVSRCRDQDRLLKSGLFKHIFVHTAECKQTIVKKGWCQEENLSVLLNAFDENCHYKIHNIQKDIDVLFVGSILPRRRIILDDLKKYFNVVETKAYGIEMTKLFNRAKIILNIHGEEFPDTETRVFETLGCGSFLLSEKLSDDNPFISGKHLVEFENYDDLKQKISFYLNNDDKREEIALNGYNEAQHKHTFVKRSAEIIDTFSRYINNKHSFTINKQKVLNYKRKESLIQSYLKARKILSKIKYSFISRG